MKSTFTLLIAGLLITITSCKEHPPTQEQESTPAPTVQLTATEQLSRWFTAFQHGTPMAVLMDSIQFEHQKLIKEVYFLDSLKGKNLHIDFIGMIHDGFDIDSTTVVQCQKNIGTVMDNSDYAFVCEEGFIHKGKMDLNIFLEEQADELLEEQITYNVPKEKIVPFNRKKFIEQVTGKDFAVDRLLNKESSPYFIGSEDKWIRLSGLTVAHTLVQYGNKFSIEQRQDVEALFLTLRRSRSELALSKAARHLIDLKTNKKAAVVFGSLHISDFQTLCKQSGVVGKFIIPPGCN